MPDGVRVIIQYIGSRVRRILVTSGYCPVGSGDCQGLYGKGLVGFFSSCFCSFSASLRRSSS